MNIVIAGRPNVGKSSLFNRLLGRKRALVLDTPGVTRDRIVEPVEWWVHAKPYSINLIDTGGLGHELFRKEIAIQVKTALEEADLVLFVMDIRAGLVSADEEVFQELRRSGVESKIPVIGVLNKADHDNFDDDIHQFYKLGLDHLMTVSAEHAMGIDDLKDLAVELMLKSPREKVNHEQELPPDYIAPDATEVELASLEEVPDEEPVREKRIPSIAIIGQPNVGKSTLLNAICGEDRVIVSPIAGTTVDAIDTKISWHNQDFILIDTAGIRRKNKTEQGVEVLSVVQTRKTVERADIALLLIDAEKGVYDQDEKIAGLIEEAGCSVILVLNKWDTQVNNDDFSQRLAEEQLREKIRFLGWAPLVFTTAKDSIGLDRLFRLIMAVLEQRTLKLGTKELTEFVRSESEIHNPNNAKFYMVHQVSRHPPTFVSHTSDPRKVHFSLTRHLIKAIRARWGYLGTPIRLHMVKTRNSGEK